MTDALHDLIAQAIIDDIMGMQSEGLENLELRMSYAFYERFAAWVWDRENRFPTGGETAYPSFMGIPIHRDFWDYDWKVIPLQRWPPEEHLMCPTCHTQLVWADKDGGKYVPKQEG